MQNRLMFIILLFLLFVSCGVVEKLANRNPQIKEITTDAFTILAGDTVSVHVDATDPDEDELTYSWSANGGTFLNRTSATAQWIAPETEDVFELAVTVKDKNGGETSEEISITVITNTKPAVDIVYPLDGEYLVALNQVNIQVEAEPISFIDKVEFYIDNSLIGTDKIPPFSLTWQLLNCSGEKKIKTVAYRTIPVLSFSADSVTVLIQGVVPIP